jgi:hypothetical protein
MAAENRALPFGQALQLVEIDGKLRRQRRFTAAFDLLGEKLVHGHAIESGDLMEPGDRDISVAALIGSEE